MKEWNKHRQKSDVVRNAIQLKSGFLLSTQIESATQRQLSRTCAQRTYDWFNICHTHTQYQITVWQQNEMIINAIRIMWSILLLYTSSVKCPYWYHSLFGQFYGDYLNMQHDNSHSFVWRKVRRRKNWETITEWP